MHNGNVTGEGVAYSYKADLNSTQYSSLLCQVQICLVTVGHTLSTNSHTVHLLFLSQAATERTSFSLLKTVTGIALGDH